jgi:hypothetical protein
LESLGLWRCEAYFRKSHVSEVHRPGHHAKHLFPKPGVASFKSTGVVMTEDRNHQNDRRKDLISDDAQIPLQADMITKTSDLYSGKVFYAMELLTPEEGNA